MRFIFLLIFLLGCSKGPATYKDMTENYELPPEMQGCKVFVLGGGYTATYPLWVIVSPEGKILTAR